MELTGAAWLSLVALGGFQTVNTFATLQGMCGQVGGDAIWGKQGLSFMEGQDIIEIVGVNGHGK